MGTCSSREQSLYTKPDDVSDQSYDKIMKACSSKNFEKGYKYSDADYILFAFNGDINAIQYATKSNQIPQLLQVRGFSQTLKLNLSMFSGEISSSGSYSDPDTKNNESNKEFSTKMWNPTLFAVYNNKLETVKYLLSESQSSVNKLLCLSLNPFDKEKQTNPTRENDCMALLIAIANKNIDMLAYLLNGQYQLWNQKHIFAVIREIISKGWDSNALGVVLNGRCFKHVLFEQSSLEGKLQFLQSCFGFIFENLTKHDFEISSFNEQEQNEYDEIQREKEENAKKWRFSICKKFLQQSDVMLEFGLFLVKYGYYSENDLYIKSLMQNLWDQDVRIHISKEEIENCVMDQALVDDDVRILYERLCQLIHLQKNNQVLDFSNTEVMLLKYIKSNDSIAFQETLPRINPLRIEQIFDEYGELDFYEEEQNEILSLFETKDISILRRINPITMCILYNRIDFLKVLCEKQYFVLRRRHIKGPFSTEFKYYGVSFLFKAATLLKNYSVFIYLWDNFAHLFKLKDLCEGSRLIIQSQNKILTKHLLTCQTTQQFFNVMSFAYRFYYLTEFVFNQLKFQSEDPKTKLYLNLITNELCQQPYSFYSFALFYEKGDIYRCLKSLEMTHQRDLRIFVKNNPRSAQRFVGELINDEVGMKLYKNSQAEEECKETSQKSTREESKDFQDTKKIDWKQRIECINLFRQSMDNLARAIQVELKLLDINEMTKSKSSNSN